MAGYRKLGRTSSQRKALLRNQVTNLLYHGKIVTTEAKAKGAILSYMLIGNGFGCWKTMPTFLRSIPW